MTGVCVDGHAHRVQNASDLDETAMRMRGESIEQSKSSTSCLISLREVMKKEGPLRRICVARLFRLQGRRRVRQEQQLLLLLMSVGADNDGPLDDCLIR